jgi:hypothetical protein
VIVVDDCRCAVSAGGAATVALDVEFEDGGVMDEAVDGGDGHGRLGEDALPGREGLVGGDQHAASLPRVWPLASPRTGSALGDELEENAGLGLVFADIADVVEDQEVELVELGECCRQLKVAPRSLEALDEVAGAAEEDAKAVVDQGMTGVVPVGRTDWRLG